MTDNKFAGMNVKQIAKTIFYDAEETVERVDAAFEALKQLEADKYRQVVDAIEKLMIADVDLVIKDMKEKGKISARDLDRIGKGCPEILAGSQAASQVAVHIAQIKGDATDPLIKAIAQEFNSLSREDRESLSKLLFVPVNAYNAVAAAQIPPAPKKARSGRRPGPGIR